MAAVGDRRYWFDPPDPTDRRRWAAPAGHGRYGDIELDYLDLDSEDDRVFLIEAEHPAMARALERGKHQITENGQTVNPQLHLTMHQIVVNRLWDDQPPETWTTASRLAALGYSRHVTLHMIMSVVSDEIYAAMTGQPVPSAGEIRARLDALPAGWPPPDQAHAH